MFAIVRTGGKQYKVSKNDVVLVEKLAIPSGSVYTFETVLMVGNGSSTVVGTPLVDQAEVTAVVEKEIRQKKIIVFKKKRRHTYKRKKGHRQSQTVLRILDIKAAGIAPLETAPAVEKKAKVSEGTQTSENKTVAPKKASPKKAASGSL